MGKTIIGLTGNIGTGKSAIMEIAAEHGVLTIDADKVVHHLMAADAALRQKIGQTFGEKVLTAGGSVDRAALGRMVFGDPAALRKLEQIVHPAVRRQIKEQIAAASAEVIMIEAIKLLEGDLKDECDQIWVADCGKLLQMQRLVAGRGMNEDEAFQRIASQSPQTEKVAAADVVIDTRGTLSETRQQVLAALKTIFRPEPEPEPPAAPVLVRRARPSDIPSILLVIHRATDGRVKPKRADILMSLSERGYLLGQQGTEISTVIGWYADKGFGAIEQMYIYPQEAAGTTAKAVLTEVERTAGELMCEAIFAFVTEDTPDLVRELLADEGFMSEESSAWPRVWQKTLEELTPPGTTRALIKKLWNARVA